MSVVAEFYNRFPYPIRPTGYASPRDVDFWVRALNHEARRADPCCFGRILVAGCGTGQAVTTAHYFPHADVVGIDISSEAIRLSQEDADATGLKTLGLEVMDLLDARGSYDAIFCTGVIHHLEEPQAGLQVLAKLLSDDGLLHLLVYHRSRTQKYIDFANGIRLLSGTTKKPNFDWEVAAAEALLKAPLNNEQADIHIHPVKHAFTLESLDRELSSVGLKLLAPTAEANASGNWEAVLPPGFLVEAYEKLDQLTRWRVRELLAPPPLLSFWVGHSGQKVTHRPPLSLTTTLTMLERNSSGTFSRHEGVPFTWMAQG